MKRYHVFRLKVNTPEDQMTKLEIRCVFSSDNLDDAKDLVKRSGQGYLIYDAEIGAFFN